MKIKIKTLERTNTNAFSDNSTKAKEPPKNKQRERLQRDVIAEQELPKDQINWQEQSQERLLQNSSTTVQKSADDKASHKRESIGQSYQSNTYAYRAPEKQKLKNKSQTIEARDTKTVYRLNKIDNKREKLEKKQTKTLRRKTSLEKKALRRNSSDRSQKAIVKKAKRENKLERLSIKSEKLEDKIEKLETRQNKIIVKNSRVRLKQLKFGKSRVKNPTMNSGKGVEGATESSPQNKPIKWRKNPTIRLKKLERKTEKYETKRAKMLTKAPKKKLTRLESGELAIKKGSRSNIQKTFYQSFHQPKKYLSNDLRHLERQQGNEGVLLAHKTETLLKEKIAKPFVRKHVPFGFDRKQYRSDKLLKKKNFAKAKKDILIKTSNTQLSSNKLSQTWQKRKIKREMYKRHNVKRGIMAKLQGGAQSLLSKINPLTAIQQTLAAVNAAISSAFLAIKILLLGSTLILFVIVPVITLVNVFGIFFSWGADEANGTDQEAFFIAETNRYYSGRLADLRMSLIVARDTLSFPGYSNLSEVHVFDATTNDGQTAHQRQIRLLGALAAYYQDDLNLATAQAYIDGLIDTIFPISTTLVDAGWWTGGNHCRCCDSYNPRVWIHYWILYISLHELYWDGYIQNTLESIEDPDHQELAFLQFEQYQELLGLAQIGANPFGENVNWLTGVSSVYGYRIMNESKELHNGIDIGCPVNTPLFAIDDGVVTAVGYNSSRGHYIEYQIITEGLGDITVTYMHLNSSLVSIGEPISSGQQIALSGNTGCSTGPHLHLEMSLNGKFINPLFLLEFPGLFD
ncbi:MAG: peptidoglycan DD-metalloendopeptidase family protein [Defluviitaleaceae bacterium]|nr:peptidoglycan DD-metalloendopeptidase family protein [Defluviitaleaceae bacterium]